MVCRVYPAWRGRQGVHIKCLIANVLEKTQGRAVEANALGRTWK